MRKTIDLTGKKFGRLTVIKRAEDTISDKGLEQSAGNAFVIVEIKLL